MHPIFTLTVAALAFVAGVILGRYHYRCAVMDKAAQGFLRATEQVLSELREEGPWMCQECKERKPAPKEPQP